LFYERFAKPSSNALEKKRAAVGKRLLERLLQYFCDFSNGNQTSKFIRRWVRDMLANTRSR